MATGPFKTPPGRHTPQDSPARLSPRGPWPGPLFTSSPAFREGPPPSVPQACRLCSGAHVGTSSVKCQLEAQGSSGSQEALRPSQRPLRKAEPASPPAPAGPVLRLPAPTPAEPGGRGVPGNHASRDHGGSVPRAAGQELNKLRPSLRPGLGSPPSPASGSRHSPATAMAPAHLRPALLPAQAAG